MSEYVLALTNSATSEALLEKRPSDVDFAFETVTSSGDALSRLEEPGACRLVLIEREAEPQLGRLVAKLRRRVPGLEIVLWGPSVGTNVRNELAALRVDRLDRATSPEDFWLEIRHRFRRAALRMRVGIVGLTPPIQQILETVLQIGPSDIPVLVTGPSGAGKELVAQALYAASPRAGRPFVALNVGALAETVLESELFGHEKGAFTGAVTRKEGVFERADRGTLFLDEVGEMSAQMQVRLLRALDSGEITPVGGTRSQHVDVRLIAATNRDLAQSVRHGDFREDLYYRLRVVHILMPGLAERREDIPDLVHYFLDESARLYNSRAHRVSESAMQVLQAHDWPGNVRELRNTVHSMAVLARGTTLETSDLPATVVHVETPNLPVALGRTPEQAERDVILQSLLALRRDIQEVLELLRGTPAGSPVWTEQPATSEDEARGNLRDGERHLIQAALSAVAGNRRLAAERLGISERTLYRKLREYDLR